MKPRLLFFFSFECLGTLLLPCHLLSNINNTIPTKFKLFYEMLTNFILVLLSFILYYLYSFIFFFKILTWMTWCLAESCGSWVTYHQYVVSRPGMVICGVHQTDLFFFKSKYNLIFYTNRIYSANDARWNIFSSNRRYHSNLYQIPSAKCLSELLILKKRLYKYKPIMIT